MLSYKVNIHSTCTFLALIATYLHLGWKSSRNLLILESIQLDVELWLYNPVAENSLPTTGYAGDVQNMKNLMIAGGEAVRIDTPTPGLFKMGVGSSG